MVNIVCDVTRMQTKHDVNLHASQKMTSRGTVFTEVNMVLCVGAHVIISCIAKVADGRR